MDENQSGLAALLQENFVYVNSWRTPACRPHRVEWLRYKSGIYAFVIGTEVMYIGMAAVLHRRLRNYSRRAFVEGNRTPRAVHDAIAYSVLNGREVAIYVKLVSNVRSLRGVEAQLIRQFQPAWNRSGVERPDPT